MRISNSVKSIPAALLLFAICPPAFCETPTPATPPASPTPASPPSSASIKFTLQNFEAEITPSEIVAGGVAAIRVTPPATLKGNESILVAYEGVDFDLSPYQTKDNKLMLGGLMGIPLSQKPGIMKVDLCVVAGESKKCETASLTVKERANMNDTEILDVDERNVTPVDPVLLEKMLKEEAQINELYEQQSSPFVGLGPIDAPIKYKLTSLFGIGRVYKAQIRRRIHWGVDYAAPLNTPVKASQTGHVVFSGPLFFSGNTVILDHGFGVFTLYAHLTKLNVKLKDLVKKGELVGTSGKSGKVTGPVLHWQSVIHRVKVDPLHLVEVSKVFGDASVAASVGAR